MHWLEFNRYCAAKSKRGAIHNFGPGLENAWSNTLLIINNLTSPTQPIASAKDLESLAATAIADAAPRGLPWMFGLSETHFSGSLEEMNAILAGVGLHHMMDMTVMECEGDLLEPTRPLPEAGIEYRRIRSRQEAWDALDLNCKAYGMPEAVTRDVVDAGTYFSDPDRDFGIVAYDTATGEPVSTATVIRDLNGWNYVAAVATNAAHRQKGYAEAAIRKALREAGATGRTSLDASRMGQPLYAQMGYEVRHRWNFWTTAAEAPH
jgi:GNAT superfamily N-acetyltransferase